MNPLDLCIVVLAVFTASSNAVMNNLSSSSLTKNPVTPVPFSATVKPVRFQSGRTPSVRVQSTFDARDWEPFNTFLQYTNNKKTKKPQKQNDINRRPLFSYDSQIPPIFKWLALPSGDLRLEITYPPSMNSYFENYRKNMRFYLCPSVVKWKSEKRLKLNKRCLSVYPKMPRTRTYSSYGSSTPALHAIAFFTEVQLSEVQELIENYMVLPWKIYCFLSDNPNDEKWIESPRLRLYSESNSSMQYQFVDPEIGPAVIQSKMMT